MVHRRAGDAEREGRDRLIHEDSEVVSEISTSDTKGPHGGYDEDISSEEKRNCRVLDYRRQECWMCGLVCKSFIVAGLC